MFFSSGWSSQTPSDNQTCEGLSWQPSSVSPVWGLLLVFFTSVFTCGLFKRSAHVCQVCQTGNPRSWLPSEQTNGRSNQTGGYHKSNNAAAQKLTGQTDMEALFQTFRVCTHERSDKTSATASLLHSSVLFGSSRQEPGCKQKCVQAGSTKSTTALSLT